MRISLFGHRLHIVNIYFFPKMFLVEWKKSSFKLCGEIVFSIFPGHVTHDSWMFSGCRFLQSTLRTNTCRICRYATVYHWITPTQHCIIHCGIYFWLLPVLLLLLLQLIFSGEPGPVWSVLHGGIFCFGMMSRWGFSSFWSLTVAVATFWIIIIMSLILFGLSHIIWALAVFFVRAATWMDYSWLMADLDEVSLKAQSNL